MSPQFPLPPPSPSSLLSHLTLSSFLIILKVIPPPPFFSHSDIPKIIYFIRALMGFLGVLVLVSVVGWLSAWLFRKYARVSRLIDRIQGPTTRPLIGNLHQVRLNPDGWWSHALPPSKKGFLFGILFFQSLIDLIILRSSASPYHLTFHPISIPPSPHFFPYPSHFKSSSSRPKAFRTCSGSGTIESLAFGLARSLLCSFTARWRWNRC